MRRDLIKFLRLFFMIFSGVGLLFSVLGVILAAPLRMGVVAMLPFLLCGAIPLLVGLAGLLVIARRARLHRWLLENGRPVNAQLDGCVREYGVRYCGRVPYVIECHYTDAETRTIYRFRSAYLWSDPEPFLNGRTTVRVLVDPRNYRRYLVDTKGLSGGYQIVG
ncbi:hypothetical protein AALA99_07775 [Anaerotruncus colihominis]|uniref:hypothetical protein n=1 Tax=Anaerotruncus colihominis TaxID=169435 RepID=UPI00351462E3